MSINARFILNGRVIPGDQDFDNIEDLHTALYSKVNKTYEHRTREDELLFNQGIWVEAIDNG